VLAECARIVSDESEWHYVPLASTLVGKDDDNAYVGPYGAYKMEARLAFDSVIGNTLDTCVHTSRRVRNIAEHHVPV
jgi:hypothetical protein